MIKPKHRRAVFTSPTHDHASLAECTGNATGTGAITSRCQDLTCPKHNAMAYSVYVSRSAS